ncbi:MAG: 50S ribosomal protein L15 [Parachlamydiaceae bacterium]|nr:50S ribosomal protein L15 [Parachlamydiaceae bacterium]
MLSLGALKNTSRPKKSIKRVGRGLGSGLGKTSGRGEKGAGSRSGYKRRLGYEGGQFRTFMKMPIRGFNNARFRDEYKGINLGQIDAAFEDGEIVNMETLADRGIIKGRNVKVKILGGGELTKKVTIDISTISESAKEKLQNAKIPFNVPSNA